MQTIYYTTPNVMRPTSNIVDLAQYRRKLALAQGGHAGALPSEEPLSPCAPPLPRQARAVLRTALLWEACASVGVLVMTLCFTLRVLLF